MEGERRKVIATGSIFAQVLHSTEFTDDLVRVQNMFKAETDRAFVILACSAFDAVLLKILKRKFIEVSQNKDNLFGAMGPLGTFSSKIEICYRLGLISKKLNNDINVIRKIRNEFAHNLEDRSLEEPALSQKIQQIISRCPLVDHNARNGDKNPTYRRKLEVFVGAALVILNNLLDTIEATAPCNQENFLYPNDE